MPKLPNQSQTVTLAVADFPRSVHTEVKVHAARRGLRLKEALAELVLAGLDNTHLLGAAPDLLDALQWIVEFIHEHPEWDDNYFREKGEMKSESLWFNEAQAAIAKATGNNYCPE